MTFQQIIKKLKQSHYAPVYFLQGTETYYLDQITNHIEQHTLPPTQKNLNLRIYYGKEHNLANILSHARCLPMLGNRQVIIVKEAQEMADLQRAEGQKKLIEYLAQPNLKTLLLFVYKHKTLKGKKFTEAFKKGNHILYTTKKTYDNQITSWITNHVSQKGYTITPKATLVLATLLGTNLQLLANELAKIMINLPKGAQITKTWIIDHVGLQREMNVFELQKAIALRQADKAIQVMHYLCQNEKKNPIIPMITLLATFFLKVLQLHHLPPMQASQQATTLQIHPYFLKDYQAATRKHTPSAISHHLQILHRADTQLKGINAKLPPAEILKETVTRILLH